MWLYRSPIGNIYIKKLENGLYGMVYNGTVWEACDTPQAEANNVYLQVTGCSDWDLCDITGKDVPSGLSEWDVIE